MLRRRPLFVLVVNEVSAEDDRDGQQDQVLTPVGSGSMGAVRGTGAAVQSCRSSAPARQSKTSAVSPGSSTGSF